MKIKEVITPITLDILKKPILYSFRFPVSDHKTIRIKMKYFMLIVFYMTIAAKLRYIYI